MFIRAGEHLIRAVSFGQGKTPMVGQEGKTSFVAHGGWTGSWELWEQPFEVLSKERRCIGFDHLGSGESPIPPGSTLTMDLLVENLRQVLDALDVEKCILAGESSGTKVVLQFALTHPERVKALVLVDGFAGCSPKSTMELELASIRDDYDGFVRNFVDRCIPGGERHFIRWGNNIIKRSSVDDAALLWKIGSEVDLTYRLDELSTPTLILHGERDEIVPIAAAKRLHTSISNSTLISIPNAGHVPTITHPEFVTASIQEFLTRVD